MSSICKNMSATPSTSTKHQERNSELYNLLTSPKVTPPSTYQQSYPSTSNQIGRPTAGPSCTSPGVIKWSKAQPLGESTRKLQEVPADTIRSTCRERRSRGFIHRMIATKRVKRSGTDDESGSIDASYEDADLPLKKRGRRKAIDELLNNNPPSRKIAMTKWRVKWVVERHIDTLKALSQLTINMLKMPGDLKKMDIKPRLLGSDRITILQYQDTLRTVLQEEHEILHNIHAYLREAAKEFNLSEEAARREAEEAADQLTDYCQY